ncbi:hypothetical protein Q8A67_022332 [Cirrhinus molitorella]|uniref:Uncharacterized protein n=1 Tax=Cirrhinus molitorella TaxID=172907 RepID=A0AA88TLS7_9TELE|nr:hypothetical protein Q8A67_022332 [Cirrhinus molitorella]
MQKSSSHLEANTNRRNNLYAAIITRVLVPTVAGVALSENDSSTPHLNKTSWRTELKKEYFSKLPNLQTTRPPWRTQRIGRAPMVTLHYKIKLLLLKPQGSR